MVELTDEVLEGFVRHAVGSGRERNPRPLLADRVELLVAEVRRARARVAELEAAIEQHRDDWKGGQGIRPRDRRLWAALEDNDG